MNPIYTGSFSTVLKCRQLSSEECAAAGNPHAVATRALFIVPAGLLWPGFAIYRAWFVSVITLSDIPGVPPAAKLSPEMTHELIFIAADPNVSSDPDPDDPRTWVPFACKVAEQFIATDDQAVRLAELCAKAVADGYLPAVDLGDSGRAAWRRTIDRTLEHMNTGGHEAVN